MIVPRDYQQTAIDLGVAYLTDPKQRGRNGLIVAPTGSGKSIVIAGIATRLDAPTLVFQPSKEILEQNLAKLAHYGYKAAVFSASMGRREIGSITLATIGSVVRYPEAFAEMRYVLIDECHALANPKGGQFDEFLSLLPQARIIGLTATPYRLASNSFGSQLRFLTRTRPRIFRDVVHQTPIGWLFDEGYLTPPAYRAVGCLRPEKLKPNSTGADYTDKSVQQEMFEVGFVGELQAQVEREFDEGRKNCLVFTRFVEESRRLARVIPGTAVVTAESSPAERAQTIADYRGGRIRCVANVGVLGIGFDFPELESVVLGAPSVSLARYYQQVGRIIRPVYADGADLSTAAGRRAAIAAGPKPVAHVVDLVGLTQQFGPVEELTLTPGGATGEQWAICAGDRPLTNVYFHQISGVDPVVAQKAANKRQFWAKRNRR